MVCFGSSSGGINFPTHHTLGSEIGRIGQALGCGLNSPAGLLFFTLGLFLDLADLELLDFVRRRRILLGRWLCRWTNVELLDGESRSGVCFGGVFLKARAIFSNRQFDRPHWGWGGFAQPLDTPRSHFRVFFVVRGRIRLASFILPVLEPKRFSSGLGAERKFLTLAFRQRVFKKLLGQKVFWISVCVLFCHHNLKSLCKSVFSQAVEDVL